LNTRILTEKLSGATFGPDKLLIVCLALFPVLTLTLRGWMNACLLLAFCLSLYILVSDKNRKMDFAADADAQWTWAFVIAMAAPLAAIFLGQLFRQQFAWADYDSASKFLLAISVALVIIKHRINAVGLIAYAIPAAVLIAAISVSIHPDLKWGGRITTYFVDPLSFGSICLTLALVSLVSIDLGKPDTFWIRAYKLAGFVIGLYLSFKSGSRTGWLALPVVLWLWLWFRKDIPRWLIFTAAVLFCAIIYFSADIVKLRIDAGVNELLSYRWNSLNQDTSVELRISFIRIGWSLFSQNPLGGWGDRGFKLLLDAPELHKFASAYASDFTWNAGFHNEIVTNMVRSGIWGLFSSVALFTIPLALFIKGLRSRSVIVRNHALLAASYLICVIVSGMSTEVFNLKYAASFHAMMIAVFVGTILVLMRSEEISKSI
jgi:O-antigen ligase